jgi:chromosome segregation ATPase
MIVDKETLRRILVNPTRTGLVKVEKEVTRLNGVNDVLRQELVTWKDAVAARNETIEILREENTKLQRRIESLREDKESANRRIRENQKKDAVQVERTRLGVNATRICIDALASRLGGLSGSLGKLENEVFNTRNDIAGDVEIDWAKELGREFDDTDSE